MLALDADVHALARPDRTARSELRRVAASFGRGLKVY
jgi:hypothetical protein